MSPPGGPLDPVAVTGWDESAALEQLDRWSSEIPPRRLEEIDWEAGTEALVLGDSHGDWPTVRMLAERQLALPRGRLVLLGDYVDRTPAGLPQGSLRNALYVLSLRASAPGRVSALRGNHETQRQIPAGMHALPDEARQLWGSDAVAERVQDLLDRLPLAARTASGAYFAHAGIPLDDPRPLAATFAQESERLLLQVVWNDVDRSPACGHRGIEQTPIGAANLEEFLRRIDCGVVVRGHDPDLAGTVLFGGHLVTVHGARVFREAGLTAAHVPLGERIAGLASPQIERLDFPPLPARVA